MPHLPHTPYNPAITAPHPSLQERLPVLSCSDGAFDVFEAQPQTQAWTASRTLCYWTTVGDNTTMISSWNYSAAAQDLLLKFFFEGGSYRLPVHLEPGADLELDLATLIRTQKPNDQGAVIRSNLTKGSAILSAAESERTHIEIASSTATFNVRNDTCTPQCAVCNGVASTALLPAPINLPVSGSIQGTAKFTYNTGYSYQLTTGAHWSGTSTASAALSGLITGLQPEQTSIGFYNDDVFYESNYCTTGTFNCPSGFVQGGGPVTVSNCPVPSGETTVYVRQTLVDDSAPTASDFLQTLDLPTTNFNGGWVVEAEGTTGSDSCCSAAIPNNPYGAFTNLAPPGSPSAKHTWYVGSVTPGNPESQVVNPKSDQWGADEIGYVPGAVSFYQQNRPKLKLSLPYGFRVYQNLTFSCAAAAPTLGVAYQLNVLTSTIDSTGITNCRGVNASVCSPHYSFQH